MHTLAVAYHAGGRQEEAMKLEEQVEALMIKVMDPQHPWTGTVTQTLKRWRGELPASSEASPVSTLAEALAETLSHREETVSFDATEFRGERIGDSRVTRLGRAGLELNKQPDCTWEANLSKVKDFSDLTIFQGTRLSRLILTGTAVVDLEPLRGNHRPRPAAGTGGSRGRLRDGGGDRTTWGGTRSLRSSRRRGSGSRRCPSDPRGRFPVTAPDRSSR